MTQESMILAVLADETGADAVLRHAAQAAAALPGGGITVLHVQVDPYSTIMPTEEMLSDAQAAAIRLEGRREGATLLAVFDAWRAGAGVPADWQDVVGTVDGQVRQHAEGAALLVIAAPRQDPYGRGRQALHAALFDTGRPVLAVPTGHVAGPVSRIVVGWKDSAVSRRAVQAALPWLKRAGTIDFVLVGAGAQELAGAEQLLAGLGVTGTARVVAEGGLADGDRLLAEAEASGADWLVMGAYRHSRMREWMLGGVTRTVLGASKVPLFLVH